MASIARLSEASPTANLLRNSRLFAIPQPLPRPGMERKSGGARANGGSDTATTPYPTHQAIGVPDSSRHRGDWGLKRPLPKVSTRSTTAIRINSIDTYERITEFESAMDHVKTLQKLQELNLTITRPNRGLYAGASWERRNMPPSAFESQYDRTAPTKQTLEESQHEKRTGKLLSRWRMRGPEIRGQPQAAFDEYVTNEVSKRIHEFSPYLKSFYAKKYAESELLKAPKDEESLPQRFQKWIMELPEEQLAAYLTHHAGKWFEESITQSKAAKSTISSTKKTSEIPSFDEFMKKTDLFSIVRLSASSWNEAPSIDATSAEEKNVPGWADVTESDLQGEDKNRIAITAAAAELEAKFIESIQSNWPDYLARFRNTSGTDPEHRHLMEYFLDLPSVVHAENNRYDSSELSTHPSAGLSYRRSSHVIFNHPEFGPLRGAEPHRARLLPSGSSSDYASKLTNYNSVGIAGVVASPESNLTTSPFSSNERIIRDKHLRGAPKSWVVPTFATISPEGKLKLGVARASDPMAKVASKELDKVRDGDFDTLDDLVKESGTEPSIDEKYKSKRAKPLNLPKVSSSGRLESYLEDESSVPKL